MICVTCVHQEGKGPLKSRGFENENLSGQTALSPVHKSLALEEGGGSGKKGPRE